MERVRLYSTVACAIAALFAGCATGTSEEGTASATGARPGGVVRVEPVEPAEEPVAGTVVIDHGDSTPPPAMSAPSPEATVPAGPKVTYHSAAVSEPVVALTFDDGPHAKHTPRLLDLLKKKGVRATFFVVGQNVELYPDLTKRIVAEGHEVANHSWSHANFTKLSDAGVRSQMQRTQDLIEKVTGVRPNIMRPPYGAITQRQKQWIHDEFGTKILMWSVDPLDWKRPGPGVVTQRILAGAKPGAILLAHDIHAQTVDAMPATIDGLVAKGYRFATVGELIEMEQRTVEGLTVR